MFQNLACYSLVFHKDFNAYTTEKLQELGLNFGLIYFVIYVGKHSGCSQSELTSALQLDWGYSQRSITKLVEDGFMTKEKNGRRYLLNLTDKGQQAFQICHQVFLDWDEENLSDLTESERDELFRILDKVAQKKNFMEMVFKNKYTEEELP